MSEDSKSGPGCAKVSEAEFVRLIETLGMRGTARALDLSERNVYSRRDRIEKRTGQQITVPDKSRGTRAKIDCPQRVELEVKNGVVLIGSDSHYWPGIISTAHRAFVKFCKEMSPRVVIKNGDVMDGASISRHPPIGWETRPSLIQEIEACKERMGEIVLAAGKARRLWPLGNHDARFETRLAMAAPEYANVHGVHLHDHFPDWDPCWSVWINDDVVVKHRFKGGIHAPHNNTLWSGKTIITGHLHSLKVSPLTDYTGVRFGVDCGTLADIYGPMFTDYTEDSPRNWRSGFVVLTFVDGKLMWPEVCHVVDNNTVDFRGKLTVVR